MSKGVQGNFAAQVRVFAHDAVNITKSDTVNIPGTGDRGVCLYVNVGGNINVLMEGSSTPVLFKGVVAGQFLPILVKRVYVTDTTPAVELIALYQNMWLGIGYMIPQLGGKGLSTPPVEGSNIISETGTLILLTENGNDEMVIESTP